MNDTITVPFVRYKGWSRATRESNRLAYQYGESETDDVDDDASSGPFSNWQIIKPSSYVASTPSVAQFYFGLEDVDRRPVLALGPFMDIYPHCTTLSDVFTYRSQLFLVPTQQVLVATPTTPLLQDKNPFATSSSEEEEQHFPIDVLDARSLHMPRHLSLLHTSRHDITRWRIPADVPYTATTANRMFGQEVFRYSRRFSWCVDIIWNKKRFWQALVILRGIYDRSAQEQLVWLPNEEFAAYVWHPLMWLGLVQAEPWPDIAFSLCIQYPPTVLSFPDKLVNNAPPKVLETSRAELALYQRAIDEKIRTLLLTPEESIAISKRRMDMNAEFTALASQWNGAQLRVNQLRETIATKSGEQEMNQKQLVEQYARSDKYLQDLALKLAELHQLESSPSSSSLDKISEQVSKMFADSQYITNRKAFVDVLIDATNDALKRKDEIAKELKELSEKYRDYLAKAAFGALSINTMQQRIDELEDKLKIAEKIQRQQEADSLKLREENTQLVTTLKAQEGSEKALLQAQADLTAANEQLEKLQAENQTLREQRAQFDEIRQEIAKDLDFLRQQHEDMKGLYAKATEEHDAQEKLIEQLRMDKQQLEGRVTALSTEIDRVSNSLDLANIENESLEQQVEDAQNENDKLRKEGRKSALRTASLISERASVLKHISDLQTQIKRSKANRTALLDRLNTMRDTIQGFGKRVKALNVEVDKNKAAQARLLVELDRQRNLVKQSERARRTLEERVKENEREKEDIYENLIIAEQRIRLHEQEYAKLKRAYEELERDLDKVRESYQHWAETAKEPRALQMALSNAPIHRTYPQGLRGSESPLVDNIENVRATASTHATSGDRVFVRIVEALPSDADILGDESVDEMQRLGFFDRNILHGKTRRALMIYARATTGLPIFVRDLGSPGHYRNEAPLMDEYDTILSSHQARDWRIRKGKTVPAIVAMSGIQTYGGAPLQPTTHFHCVQEPDHSTSFPIIPRSGYIIIEDNEPYGLGGVFVYSVPAVTDGKTAVFKGYLPGAYFEMQLEPLLNETFRIAQLVLEPKHGLEGKTDQELFT